MKAFLISVFIFSVVTSFAETRTEIVLPSTSLYVTSVSGSQTFNLNFSRTQLQLGETYQYSITIKNADGEEHAVVEAKDCKDYGHVEKLACLSRRTANLFYVNNVRVHQANVFFNSLQISNKSTFNRNTANLTLPLSNLSLQNSIQLDVEGSIGAYIQVEVTVAISITDELPPVVTSSLTTGALTKSPGYHILINDQSNTTTEVYHNSALLITSTEKDIALELTEGLNSLLIKSRDEYGNTAPDFLLENIVLDTIAPDLNSNLKTDYFFNSLPGSIDLEFYPSEPLSSLTLNGQSLIFDTSIGYYQSTLPILDVGSHSLEIVATDLAGNQKIVTYNFNVAIDNIAPALTFSQLPLVIISDYYLLPVEVTDANETLTTISVDGFESAVIREKVFSYWIDFPEDGPKEISVRSVDAAQNITVRTFTITKNTAPFVAQVVTPLNNTTVNSRLVEIVVTANKPIQEVLVNSIIFPIPVNSFTAQISIQLFNDGSFDIPVHVTDIFGATSDTQVKFQISTNSLSSWNYLECRAE